MEKEDFESSYTVEALKNAVEEVKSGNLTSWQAKVKYNIPYTTIYGHAKGWTNRPAPVVIGRALTLVNYF